MKNFSKTSWVGFTLIELMIVVAIIGILVAFGYPKVQNLVKINLAKNQMREIVRFVQIAREVDNKTLIDMTDNGCSECSCRNGNANTTTCRNDLDKFFKAIGYKEVLKNPWGGIFFVDENDGETADCRADTMVTYNPVDDNALIINFPTLSCTDPELFGGVSAVYEIHTSESGGYYANTYRN